MNAPKEKSVTCDATLFEDSAWKEAGLCKLEIVLDDERNPECANFGEVGEFMKYGKKYRITITITEIMP